jgi:hypothetical protein
VSETKQYGVLASQCGYQIPVEVLESNAGLYLGTYHVDHGPISRESVEYWPTHAAAEEALNTGNWTQKPNP